MKTNTPQMLLQLLEMNEELLRSEIVRLTKIPRSTVYDNLVKLENKGLVKRENRKLDRTLGRSNTFWMRN